MVDDANIGLKRLQVKQQLINLLIVGVTCWVTVDQLCHPGSNKVDQLLINWALIQNKHVTQLLLNFWSGKQRCCSTIDQCISKKSTCWSTITQQSYVEISWSTVDQQLIVLPKGTFSSTVDQLSLKYSTFRAIVKQQDDFVDFTKVEQRLFNIGLVSLNNKVDQLLNNICCLNSTCWSKVTCCSTVD